MLLVNGLLGIDGDERKFTRQPLVFPCDRGREPKKTLARVVQTRNVLTGFIKLERPAGRNPFDTGPQRYRKVKDDIRAPGWSVQLHRPFPVETTGDIASDSGKYVAV